MSKLDNDTLLCLFLHGPTYDGDVPSKVERDELYEAGLIARGKGFQWLTDTGVIHCLLIGYEAKQRRHQHNRRALAQDADRYRFLRNHTYVEAYWIDGAGSVDTKIRVEGAGENLDRDVDTARLTPSAGAQP